MMQCHAVVGYRANDPPDGLEHPIPFAKGQDTEAGQSKHECDTATKEEQAISLPSPCRIGPQSTRADCS